nr:MAG TPA_asm: hypothetical protein [Caudoviricetes sp.]
MVTPIEFRTVSGFRFDFLEKHKFLCIADGAENSYRILFHGVHIFHSVFLSEMR